MSTQQADALTLRLERTIPAAPERVFAAWTQSELLERWSSPEGMTVREGSMDLRVGGQWRVVVLKPDGTPHEAFGTYREITPPSRLVYTHAWTTGGGPDGRGPTPQTELTVEFLPAPQGTRVVLTQVGFGSEGSRDGHDVGWSSSLDKLEAMFASDEG